MRAAKLSSSLIARIAYVDDERTLKVWFRDGPLYCYFDVPAGAYEVLRDSPSGRHYNQRIKGRYRCSVAQFFRSSSRKPFSALLTCRASSAGSTKAFRSPASCRARFP